MKNTGPCSYPLCGCNGESLWGDLRALLPTAEREPRPQLVILRHQAGLVPKMTDHAVHAGVVTFVEDNLFTHTLKLWPRGHQHAAWSVVEVNHGLEVYPCQVSDFDGNTGGDHILVHDRAGFEDRVRVVLASSWVRLVVANLWTIGKG